MTSAGCLDLLDAMVLHEVPLVDDDGVEEAEGGGGGVVGVGLQPQQPAHQQLHRLHLQHNTCMRNRKGKNELY